MKFKVIRISITLMMTGDSKTQKLKIIGSVYYDLSF